jgi:hypothetical protein
LIVCKTSSNLRVTGNFDETVSKQLAVIIYSIYY